MKSKKRYIIILLIVTILIMILNINKGYVKGHDTDFHVANISSIFEQLSIKNILVQEPLKNIANNFGYGTRFFYPPIPHLMSAYITKCLTIFNINDVTIGMRITQGITIFASGVTFFYLAEKIFKNKKISTVLALFYMTAPYHLSEIFIRDAFSEMFIPIAIPLIILGLLYLTEKNYKHFLLCFVGGYVLAIYTHLAMTIYFTLIILVTFFTVYFKQIFNKKNILYLLLASILILLLTASFWLPMLEIKIKGSYGVFMPYFMTGKGDLRFSTIKLTDLIGWSRTFVIYHLQVLVNIMFVIGLIIFIKKKMWKEKLWLFLVAFTLLSIIMVTSLFPWYYTPDILQTLQFPWRLVLYIDFGAILISGILLKKLENKKWFDIVICVLCIYTIISSYYYIGNLNNTTVDINNIDYNLGVGNQAEYLPENTLKNREYYNNRTNEIIIQEGSGNINVIEDDVPNLTFEVEINSEKIIIELPRLYYMGYTLESNGEEIQLTQSSNGFLQATIEKSGTYNLRYSKTMIMKIANWMSLLTLVSIIVVVVVRKSKEIYSKKN